MRRRRRWCCCCWSRRGWDFPIASGQTGHRNARKRGGYPAKSPSHSHSHSVDLWVLCTRAKGYSTRANLRNYSGGNWATENVVIYGLIIVNTHTQLGSQADTSQTPPRPRPDAVKLKINFVTVAHRRIVSLWYRQHPDGSTSPRSDHDDDEPVACANCERGEGRHERCQLLSIRAVVCRRKLNRFVRRVPGRVIIRIFPFFAFAF